MQAGRFTQRIRFERRGQSADDGYGNVLAAWAPLVTRWADWLPETGREAVASGRLQSQRPGTLTIRRDSTTAGITTADRVVFLTDENTGTIGAIQSLVPSPETIDIVILIGGAT